MLATAGRKAIWLMLSVTAARGSYSTGMKLTLFGTMVSPMPSYCSEVWGPYLLDQSGEPSHEETSSFSVTQHQTCAPWVYECGITGIVNMGVIFCFGVSKWGVEVV